MKLKPVLSDAEGMYQRWIAAARDYVASATTCDEFFELRHRYLAEVAREATTLGPGRRVPSKYIVYGVYVEDHLSPVYIGQSCVGRTRLRNLVFGEGHHLATSVPPETWERIVIVDWRHAIDREILQGAVEAAAWEIGSRRGVYSLIGLTLEFMLQSQLEPVFNLRVKRKDGSYERLCEPKCSAKVRRLQSSLGQLYHELSARWDVLANHPEQKKGDAARSWGNVVFPRSKLTLVR